MRTARAISLLLLLQARRAMTGAELAAELEVSERTVQRDVVALAEAGVPVYADRGRAGGYRLVEGYRTRLTGLDRAEAEVLLLAGLPGPLREMGFGEEGRAARLKAASVLGGAPELAARRFHLDAPAWFHEVESPALLGVVSRAVWGERQLRIGYRRRDREVERTLRPYGLVLKAGVWYLVAEADDDHRVYRVDRLTTAAVGGEGFTRDPDFDLAACWEAKSAEFARALLRETVTVRLSPSGAARLAAAVALGEAGEPDGEGWVTVRLPVESLDVAYDELLRLGPEVEALDPPELRASLAEAACRMRELYRSHR